MTALKMQRLAMKYYHPGDYPPSVLTDKNAAERLSGDTLALFIWREVGGASDLAEAARWMKTAAQELQRVVDGLETAEFHAFLMRGTKPPARKKRK